uniref:Holin n=1 Tax=viral metagenome TaxID=1070528 RepID=A0A6H1ZBA1_9ZZZZ
MFALLLKWFAGGGISSIGEQINRWQEVKAKAANDHERLEADKMISFYKGQIELNQIAAQHDKWWSPRTLMAWTAAAYVIKTVGYDTVLQLGVTPDPGPEVKGIVWTIIGFYFGARALTDAAGRIFASRR